MTRSYSAQRRAPRTRTQVDLLIVCSSSTPGNRRSELELVDALRDLGLRVAVASTDYGWVGRLPMSLNVMDLTRAASNRLATTRALRTVVPTALIYGTAGAALLEPADRLEQGAVRFDSLAADNRPGRRHSVQRLLEQRMVNRVALLLPFSASSTWPRLAHFHRHRPIPLPTPVEQFGPCNRVREAVAVCYGGAPEKKRLDLLIGAWALAQLSPRYRLTVTGITAKEGRRWLRRRRVEEPPGVEWRGHIAPTEYRLLTSSSEIYLSASRYEDYGIAQLEALADGALLVTTASPGPYEALALARSLNPRLVSAEPTAEQLARALREAARLSEPERVEYRARAGALLLPYSRAAFKRRLEADIIPALLGGHSTE